HSPAPVAPYTTLFRSIGGHAFATRKKYRDVLANPRVAFVVDDLTSVNPWRPRGIEVRGRAEVLNKGGEALGPGFDSQMFRVRPRSEEHTSELRHQIIS